MEWILEKVKNSNHVRQKLIILLALKSIIPIVLLVNGVMTYIAIRYELGGSINAMIMLSVIISAMTFYLLLRIVNIMNNFVTVTGELVKEELGIDVLSLSSGANDEMGVNIFSGIVKNLNEKVGRLEISNKQLEKLSFTDELTGLYNYRAFHELLSKELSRVRRKGTFLSVMMLDIDNFKQFNDYFGHQAGDIYLKEVAKIIRETLRTYDIAARYGGDEFINILPDADDEGVLSVARRISERFNSMQIGVSSFVGFSGKSVSIGITTVKAEELNFKTNDEIIKEADQALYQSKDNGKNSITVFTSGRKEMQIAS